MSARKGKKEKSGARAILNTISAILICAALVLGVSVFFRVSSIEVLGATRYSADAVIEASGVKEGGSLIFLNRDAIGERISETLVYIGRVTVKRKLPNTVVIEVHESGTVACIETESGLWLIDNYCRMLEPCPPSEADSFARVTGFAAVSPKAGKALSVPDEDKSKVEYLRDLLTAMNSADMLRDVGNIDMSTSGNPQFEYLGRFRVKLGRNDGTESKLARLKIIVTELAQTDTGVIDLSMGEKASFSPD